MQVNSSNGSLQNRYFSGTGSLGGIHLSDFNDRCMIYNEAWGNAKRGIPQAGEDTANAENIESSFDAGA